MGGHVGRIERRKRETWLQFLWAAGDSLAIVVAFAAAYWVRFRSPLTEWVPVTKGVPDFQPYVVASCILVLAWVPLFRSLGLYRVDGARTGERVWRLVRAAALAVGIGAALMFFYRGFSFSRAFFPLLFVALVAGMVAIRFVIRVVVRRWRNREPIRLAIVGASESGGRLVRHHLRTDPTGVKVLGHIALDDEPGGEGPRLGAVDAVRSLVAEHDIDVLVLALPLEDEPDTFQLLTQRARVRDVDGLPVLSLREFPLTGWNVVQKRLFDIVVAAGALAVLSPLFAILAVVVKTTSRGPVFYRQERIGRDGREFGILKFRTMRVGAEAASGPVWASKGDDRRTPVGRVLREWSLDELPQLWNVLRGEMSLVGPRPERPVFVEAFSRDLPDYLDRHRVKICITGWAQVNGLRGDTSITERTRFDLFYVENWSLSFDIKILAKTVRAVLTREEAV
jgi:lipopolysaccharide/colanic/teichoic acid biosynthesis glycosyltransferase